MDVRGSPRGFRRRTETVVHRALLVRPARAGFGACTADTGPTNERDLDPSSGFGVFGGARIFRDQCTVFGAPCTVSSESPTGLGHTSPLPARRLLFVGLAVPVCGRDRRRFAPVRVLTPSLAPPSVRAPTVPAQAGAGSGAAPGGGSPAPAGSGAARSCSAAFFATSSSRFALRSIFSQRALFLTTMRAW